MIEIATALTDPKGTYAKYAAAMMVSVMVNTAEPCRFHLLTDETVLPETREALAAMTARHGGQIDFIDVSLPEMPVDKKNLERFSRATLYRLKMIGTLKSGGVKRLIYLDSDILCHADIAELWNCDLQGAWAGVVKEAMIKSLSREKDWLETQGLIEDGRYFNAGVLLLDLVAIEENLDLFGESMAFFSRYPRAAMFDQDALNYLFREHTAFLNSRWNLPSTFARGQEESESILHFQADSPRVGGAWPDGLFLTYLRQTPWGSEAYIGKVRENYIRRRDDELDHLDRLLHRLTSHADLPIAFWGCRGNVHEEVMKSFSVQKKDVFVDGAPALWGTAYLGVPVVAPAWLEGRQGKVTVIVTIAAYDAVRRDLQDMGFVEGVDFFKGRVVISSRKTWTKFGYRDSAWDV